MKRMASMMGSVGSLYVLGIIEARVIARHASLGARGGDHRTIDVERSTQEQANNEYEFFKSVALRGVSIVWKSWTPVTFWPNFLKGN